MFKKIYISKTKKACWEKTSPSDRCYLVPEEKKFCVLVWETNNTKEFFVDIYRKFYWVTVTKYEPKKIVKIIAIDVRRMIQISKIDDRTINLFKESFLQEENDYE